MDLDCLVFILNFHKLLFVCIIVFSKKEPDDTVYIPWGRGKRNKFLGSIYVLVLFLSILIFLSSLMLVAAL